MKLIPIYFFSSLLISFLIMYLIIPEPKIIFKHPMNSKTTYIDENDVCYSYNKKEVQCPVHIAHN